ncbi:transcriptional regulator/sugar kinase [Sphaerochaeta pleomorpha str. Grapes]|uniref:Transcriptional regulator/sugar kinase n=1 Tax=Sphaerochaeta pleomorpha (strain ATCC BAA-1885 / DSM 22778 / Grapes) TaxID=158190 RepID=G8QVS1_SPHPG|nr:ROK family transcriptional regulator [Sphaerochaeta pleomorpha]AEV29363.1 transcriptional regulator/sugar kinase [Sphaerochaeta pleomorpha str. Grapes]
MELLNQQVMKAKNMKAVFSLIWDEAGISRAEIAKRLSLSKTTISSLVEELIAQSFIEDTGKQVTKTVGRRPSSLFVKERSHFVPVITWSRNTIVFHVVDLNGDIVFSQIEHIQDKDQFIPETIKNLRAICIRKAFKDKILGCCLVLPGMIDSFHNVLYSTTLGLYDTNAKVIYEKIHNACKQYPLAILQDTACYAYAEKIYTDIQVQDYAFINFNLGIGATLFVQGKMLGKANGAFTQFGHYSIDPDGAPCACGNKGCLENEIGECNLSKRFKQFSENTQEEIPEYLTYEDLGSAMEKRSETAKKVIISLATDFAQALRNVVCIINPRLIVLGGKCQHLGDLFLSQVQTSLHEQGFSQMSDYTLIRYTNLDSSSYLKGAMRYFFDAYYDFSDTSNNALFIG